MTQAQWVVQQMFREGNLIPVGTQPSTSEALEGLYVLNRLVDGIFGYELGENLRDWIFPAPQRTAPVAARFPQAPLITVLDGSSSSNFITPYPPTNRRIIWGQVTDHLYFPEQPNDGSRMALVMGSGAGDMGETGAVITLDGNGRLITSDDTVTYTAPLTTSYEWFYRADQGNWLLRADMASTDQMLFPSKFDDFFICAGAMRLAPRYSKVTAAETAQTAKSSLSRLVAQYRQTELTTYGSENFPRTDQSYLGGLWWW